MNKIQTLGLLALAVGLLLFCVSRSAASEKFVPVSHGSPKNIKSDQWDYPAGRSNVSQVNAGKAGHLRVYDCKTSDTVEQVVLWYAERLGLPVEIGLFAVAKYGFDSLQADTLFQDDYGSGTDNRKGHTQMVAHLSDGHAHVSFLHRPDIEHSAVVTISIAKFADRTSIHVVQGPIDRDAEPGTTVSQNNDGDQSTMIPESQQEVVDGEMPVERINEALREVHELLAERTRAKLKLTYFRKNAETVDADGSKTESLKQRLTTIANRIEKIHNTELASFEKVAENAGLANSEEPRFGQPSYGIILYATSVRDIDANELLMFHGDWVYRTNGEFAALDSPSAGWYFRPNVDIPKGTRFVVACHQDAPEEIENVKQGYMPNSDRARSPNRPYRTEIFGRDGKPLGRSAEDEPEPLAR